MFSFIVNEFNFKSKISWIVNAWFELAILIILIAKSINSWFFETKSVSQVNERIVPFEWLSFNLYITIPSDVFLSDLEADTFCPFFLRISIAF